ncbi:hypothetical protein LzC2_27740 [Planctomycetes bacterium LzC2]|uniref:NHL repeat-containing protein n=2 Tax=Alienimonas chondri TaxID=2681879 RepID=A0ABX1VF38_9PLAN|nr:hypothetical protein [Alienimonas chondri]
MAAAMEPTVPDAFATPIDRDVLDPDAFAQWCDGQETPAAAAEVKEPSDVVWTRDRRPHWRGVPFGEAATPGARHLRIGFTRSVPVGAVLARGGGRLSVLKPDANYPGDLADESLWLPAERLSPGSEISVGTIEATKEDYAWWALPPGTTTRALRFTHVASSAEADPAGWLGGVWALSDRVANLAPQATAVADGRPEAAGLVLNGTNDDLWGTWSNIDKSNADGPVVDAAHPATLTAAWARPVRLNGVALLWAGFDAAEVEAFTGGPDEPIDGAADALWRTVARVEGLDAFYPMGLGPNWVAFDEPIETRAIRLRITAFSTHNHSHLTSHKVGGRRVWLGELAALTPLNDAPLSSVLPPPQEEFHPPIPVRFTLEKPGVVTLVIEDADGKRVRNLIAETPFEAGEHTVWWDGSDDLARDLESPQHGLYHVPTRPVAPGTYTVRGLTRDPIALKYEMSVYSAGKPPWRTADDTGYWMTNHTPPGAVTHVPGSKTADGESLIFIGAYVSEGGHGLQWVREDGVKVGGQGHVGGSWTGAPTLATDLGPHPIGDHLCYIAGVWEGQLSIDTKLRGDGAGKLADRNLVKLKLGDDRLIKENNPDAATVKELEGFDGGRQIFVLADLAVRDGLAVLSFPRQNELRVFDLGVGEQGAGERGAGEQIGRIPLDAPRGVCFDPQGRLLAISGDRVVRSDWTGAPADVRFEELNIAGLQNPRMLTTDAAGRIYVSDLGSAHQVKVFEANGAALKTIGTPGPPSVGPYDPTQINNPHGLAVDGQGHVWVAEREFRPKRVSVWNPRFDQPNEATLARAFYGPTEYGGGGVLDPLDKTRFFYKGMEFRLDWETGTDELVRVFDRPPAWLDSHYGPYSPDTPLYPTGLVPGERGSNRYFTSCYTTSPTGGWPAAFLWKDEPERARLVAGIGSAQHWDLLKTEPFRERWPEEIDPTGPRHKNAAFFQWTDRSGDGVPQPEEVTIGLGECGGVTITNDLDAVFARFNDQAARFAARIDPATGVPTWDDAPIALIDEANGPASSGGDQALTLSENGTATGWTICTNAPPPFSSHGLGGAKDGVPMWSYPSLWPGLHASHEAAVPDRPGMVVGHTRLLGGWIKPAGEPMFAVNGNMGNAYLFTADGLLVGTVFHDVRTRPVWGMPRAERGMDVTDVSLHDENFWPSITQTADGNVYLVDGARTSLVRIDGLDSIRRLPPTTLEVSPEDLNAAREWFAENERRRQAGAIQDVATVPVRSTAPQVDGDLSDWPADTRWAVIDRRGVKANFNSNARPYEADAAVCIADGALFAAYRTGQKDLLRNAGESPNSLFKTGGALDLMLAAGAGNGPEDDPTAQRPVRQGDLRLLMTRVDGRTRAVLYRGVVPSTAEPVGFSSPWRTITLDEVTDISDRVTLADDGAGNFEVRVPLALLDWNPKPGETYRGDLGLLRGDGRQTVQRVYWSNKATAITSDVPSEAELQPSLWGRWQVVAE